MFKAFSIIVGAFFGIVFCLGMVFLFVVLIGELN